MRARTLALRGLRNDSHRAKGCRRHCAAQPTEEAQRAVQTAGEKMRALFFYSSFARPFDGACARAQGVEVNDALKAFDQDNSVRAIVLTGNEKAFAGLCDARSCTPSLERRPNEATDVSNTRATNNSGRGHCRDGATVVCRRLVGRTLCRVATNAYHSQTNYRLVASFVYIY